MKTVCKVICFVLCLIITSLCFSSCKKQEKATLNYVLSSEPLTLDPQVAKDENAKTVIINIFEGLFVKDKNGNILNGAVSEYKISDDGLNYAFTLRKDMKWSNGDSLTSSDFAFGILRAISLNEKDDIPSALLSIENAKAYSQNEVSRDEVGIYPAGSGTLIIRLERRNDRLIEALTEPCTMPCNETFFNSTRGQYGKESDMIISNGMFYVSDNYGWSHNEYINLYENEYYNGENVAGCKGITFQIGEKYKTENEKLNAIENGEIDATEVSYEGLKLASKKDIPFEKYIDGVCGIRFNTQDSLFKNGNLRKTLFASLIRDELQNTLESSVLPAREIIAEDLTVNGESYRQTVGAVFENYSVADHNKLLFDALAELGLKSLPEFTILCNDDSNSQKLASSIIESWNTAFGIYINKEPLSSDILNQRIENGDYSVAITQEKFLSANPYDTLKDFCGLSQTDSDYAEIINETYENKSETEICKNAETYIRDNMIFVPIFYTQKGFLIGKNVSGVIYDSFSSVVDFRLTEKIQ